MNDAVWKFRQFERPSLSYTAPADDRPAAQGGWSVVRDERLAALVDEGVLQPGDEHTGKDGAVATITDDYGISLGGIRYDSPDAAAAEFGVPDGPIGPRAPSTATGRSPIWRNCWTRGRSDLMVPDDLFAGDDLP